MDEKEFVHCQSKEQWFFITYIKSIGFNKIINKYNNVYVYKNYEINLYTYHYEFYNNKTPILTSEYFFGFEYEDLKPVMNEFKNELRSIKLKKILR